MDGVTLIVINLEDLIVFFVTILMYKLAKFLFRRKWPRPTTQGT